MSQEFYKCIEEWADRCREKDKAIDALQAKVRELEEQLRVATAINHAFKQSEENLEAKLHTQQDRVRELEEALRAVSSVGRNILKPKFDHCGFMNATQLGNRDAVLHMLKQVERALEEKEEHGTRSDEQPD